MGLILNGSLEKRKLPRVVTSFNEAGYKRYAKDFIDSWQKYWPASIGLTVYYEGEASAFDMHTHGISWRPYEEVEDLAEYLSCLKFPIMQGLVGNSYDINWDARMGRKTFIQSHAMKQYGGKIFWLDADSITYEHVPETFLDECLPDDKLCAFLGRDGWYYTESGFIGFNSDHPLAGRFRKSYLNTFLAGTIFTQPGWHDCWAFDAVRKVFGLNGYEGEFVNLAEGVPHGTMHPFENCAPGRYMHHYKGDRKDSKQLRDGDIVRH